MMEIKDLPLVNEKIMPSISLTRLKKGIKLVCKRCKDRSTYNLKNSKKILGYILGSELKRKYHLLGSYDEIVYQLEIADVYKTCCNNCMAKMSIGFIHSNKFTQAKGYDSYDV